MAGPRRPIWKPVALVVGVLLLAVVAFTAWIRTIAERRFTAMEQRLEAIQARLRLQNPRFGKGGGSEPGNAWTDYRNALIATSTIPGIDRMTGLVQRTINADKAFGKQVVVSHAAIIEQLRQGTKRAECDVDASGANHGTDLRYAHAMVNFCILKARSQAEAGDVAGAVDTLMVLCRFTRDYMGSKDWTFDLYGAAFLNKALGELRDLFLAGPLPPPANDNIERTLKELDETLPRQDLMQLSKIPSLAKDTLYGIENYESELFRLKMWRYGFSTRLLTVDIVDRWSAWLERAAAAELQPWSVASAQHAAIQIEIDQEMKDFPIWGSAYLELPAAPRAIRAKLRLLRLATGLAPALADPFGDGNLHVGQNPSPRVWSVGVDGTDHGGVGDWELRPGKDLVLTLPRP